MPCKQIAPTGSKRPGVTARFATEAECLQACKEGACCEGTSCTVKPQCQCQGAGKVFKGVGTVCASVSCGCCCINGVADTTKNEQQCTAAGGTWKGYSCNSPAPTSILLTLSLNNYSAYVNRSPTSTAPGVFEFDFSCIKPSYTLTYTSSPYTWIAFSDEANAFLFVSTSGSFGPGGTSTTCGCPTPLFLGGGMNVREESMSRRAGSTAAMNCAAGPIVAGYTWGLTFYYPGNAFNTAQDPVSVPGFCTGQYSVTGTVYGPGEVQCGTFTLGNPLP